MKKIFFLLVILVMSFSIVSAKGDISSTLTPIFEHMGTTTYIDTSSISVKDQSASQLLFTEDIYTKSKNGSLSKPTTIWFYLNFDKNAKTTTGFFIDDSRTIILPPYLEGDMAYVSHDNANHWMPFYTNVDVEANNLNRNALIEGLQRIAPL